MKDKKITKITIRNLGLLTAFPLLSFLGLSCLNEPKVETTTPKHSHNHHTHSTKDQEKDHAHDEKDHHHHHEHKEKTVGRVESVDDYGLLVLERERVIQKLKDFQKTALSPVEAVFDSIDSLKAKLIEANNTYEALEKLRDKVNTLTRTLENAEQDVTIASEKNWTLGKEVMLYLFGLKFLWGFVTGFAPTTSTSEKAEIFAQLEATIGRELEAKKVEQEVTQNRLKGILKELETLFEFAVNQSPSPKQRAKLLTSKLALTNTFNQLLVAGNELDTQEALYREYFRYTLPTTPFAVASVIGVSQSDDYVGKFRFASLTEARTRKKMLEAKLATLFGKGKEALEIAPATLLTESAKEISSLQQEKGQLQVWLQSLEQKINKAKQENPKFEEELSSSSVFNEHLESMRKATVQTTTLDKMTEFLKAVEILRKSIGGVASGLEEIVSLQRKLQLAAEQVALREEALREATRRRHSFFRELTLYLLGFKFLWGAKTGFAPTVNVEKETQALNLAKENLAALEKYQGEELVRGEGALKRALTSLTENYRVAKNKAVSAAQKAVLTKYFAAFQDAFEKYRKELLNAQVQGAILMRDQVAGTLYTTHTSGFIKFLENFSFSGDLSISYISVSLPIDYDNNYGTFGVLEGDGVPVLSLDMSVFQNLSIAKKEFESFVTMKGEKILEEVMKELEVEVSKQQKAQEIDSINKRAAASLSLLL